MLPLEKQKTYKNRNQSLVSAAMGIIISNEMKSNLNPSFYGALK